MSPVFGIKCEKKKNSFLFLAVIYLSIVMAYVFHKFKVFFSLLHILITGLKLFNR